MKRAGVVLGVALGMVLCGALPLYGQTGAATTPAQWQALSLSDFRAQATAALANPANYSSKAENDIISNAAARLLSDATYAGASSEDLVWLIQIGQHGLSADQCMTVARRMAQPSMTYDQVIPMLCSMRGTGAMEQAGGAMAAEWLKSHSLPTLTLPWQPMEMLNSLRRAGPRSQSFSVVWHGLVKPPYDGAFTFSACPVDLRSDNLQSPIRQSMSVWIGGQKVVTAGPDGNWTPEGTPVTLRAGEKTALRVEYSYDATLPNPEWGFLPLFPAVAQLWWQGPGVTKQLVPASALWKDDTTAGLSAEYRITVNGQPQTITRSEPVIDETWIYQQAIVPQYGDLIEQVRNRLTEMALAPDYLTDMEKPGEMHFMLEDRWNETSALLRHGQVRAFAEATLSRPSLLNARLQLPTEWSFCASPRSAFTVYQMCRLDSPETALQFWGKWAQMNADTEPLFFAYTDSDWRYYPSAYAMTRQMPGHIGLLEQNYLTTAEGGCCLPVAYALTQSRVMQRRAEEWITELDTRLQDPAVRGDLRVNWLLARAQAEELRQAAAGREEPVPQRLAGRAWLEEAILVAQSEPVRRRAYKELVVRLASEEQFDAARAQIDKAATRCTSELSTTLLNLWREKVNTAATASAAAQKQRKAAAEDAYWTEMRKRYQRASAAGDKAAVDRYEATFKAAGVTP